MKKKFLYWIMGVVMVCGANILTAYSNDDSDGPDNPGCCRYQYPRTLDWNAQMLEKIRQINMIH